MSVFRDIEMEYDGVEYVVTPNNRLLRQIEGEVSIMGMFSKFRAGKPVISELSFVVAAMLRSAGADFTEDDIYQGISIDMTENEGKGTSALMAGVAEAVTPVDKVKKQKPSKAKPTK